MPARCLLFFAIALLSPLNASAQSPKGPRRGEPPAAPSGPLLTREQLDALFDADRRAERSEPAPGFLSQGERAPADAGNIRPRSGAERGRDARKPGPREQSLAVDLRREVEVRNGQLRRFGVSYLPSGTTLEAGYLGLNDSRSDLIALSPYFNLRQRFASGPRSRLDYRLEMTAGAVDLSARYFNDRPAADPEVATLLERLAALAEGEGGASAGTREYLSYTRWSDPVRTTRIVLASVLAQVGRAYELYGPLDVGWTFSTLVKTAHLFPNAAFDASAGPRVDLGSGRSVGVYGGLTRNLSPAGNRLLQGLFAGGHPDFGARWEDAPHATGAYRGPIPGWKEMHLETSATRQWNADTVADRVRAAIATTMGGKPTEFSAALLTETGPGIEFERRRRGGEVAVLLSEGVTAAAGYQREKIRYGSASIAGETLYSNLRVKFGPGDQRADWRQTSGGKDALTAAPVKGFEKTAAALNQALGAAIGVAEGAQLLLDVIRLPALADPAQAQAALAGLSTAVRNMDPEDRNDLRDTLLSFDPTPSQRRFLDGLFSGAAPEQLAADLQATGFTGLPQQLVSVNLTEALRRMGELRELLALMSSDGVMERLAVRVGRNRLLDALAQTDEPIPQLNTRFRWSPAVFLAAANILSSRPSPPAPITAADARDGIEPWLWRGLARRLGLPEEAGREKVTSEFLSRVGRGLKEELRAAMGDSWSDRIAKLTSDEAVAELKKTLPDSALKRLQERYGEDLSGLAVAGGTGQQVLDAALQGVVDQILREKLGPLADQGAAALSQWLAGVIRSQIDAMMVQALVASEQFDPFFAGGGRKVAELSHEMIEFSHQRLAERQGRLKRVLRGSAALLQPA